MPGLIVTSEEGERKVALGREPITIGRSPANTVQISDTASSRKHCMIKSSDVATVIVDMGSANGTRVNGTKIVREQILHDGDVIRIGKTSIRFVESDPD